MNKEILKSYDIFIKGTMSDSSVYMGRTLAHNKDEAIHNFRNEIFRFPELYNEKRFEAVEFNV